MNKLYKLFFYAALLASIGFEGYSQTDDDLIKKLRELNLEDIVNVDVSVTSQTPLSTREAPGVVTVINREDILNSGAKDLMETLNMFVPGFSFLQSEYGPIGAGFRGIWGFEGKILLLLDGLVMNEEGYSGIIFGNHFLIDNIDRIEVIRGPGSVVHGGYASLAVINIVTRNFDKIKNFGVSATYAQMESSFYRRNVSFEYGFSSLNFGISLTGYIGEGKITDKPINQFYHSKDNQLKLNYLQNPANLNLQVKYSDFSFKAIYDKYSIDLGIPVKFTNVLLNFEYQKEISKNLKLETFLTLNYQKPWDIKQRGLYVFEEGIKDTSYSNQKRFYQANASVKLKYDISNNINLLTGFEIKNSKIQIDSTKDYYELPLLGNFTSLKNYIVYSQLFWRFDFMNVVVGGRFEHSEPFGSSFVPRLALTKVAGDFHFKAMYSQSYRLPTGRYFSTDLKPEKGSNFEFEVGYKFDNSHFITVNLFDFKFTDIISLFKDSFESPSYFRNREGLGTRGFEIEYRKKEDFFNFGLNLAYHKIYDNTVENFRVPDKSGFNLGFPALRFNGFVTLFFNENINLTPSFSFYGNRFGYDEIIIDPTSSPATITPILKEYFSTFLINLNLTIKNLFDDQLRIDLDISNILNTDFQYPQPFIAYNAAIPAASTSLSLRLIYGF